jgi:hypothetical protein
MWQNHELNNADALHCLGLHVNGAKLGMHGHKMGMHICCAWSTWEARLPSKGTSVCKGPPPESVSIWVTLSMPRLLIAICTIECN